MVIENLPRLFTTKHTTEKHTLIKLDRQSQKSTGVISEVKNGGKYE